ncbi:MAG TPA: SUMF1/EgtB/PvdO family nonheme iron enzyme [Steroidobacteraceae bacterium]|nr:SUMF1/EgtB/PvdO family nonheme iron enzyme [Steroidobacteraceae bacterium]
MSASAATRLRQLATQYHAGELDLATYRRARAELLDRLTSAEIDPDESSTTLPQRRPPAPPPAPAMPDASRGVRAAAKTASSGAALPAGGAPVAAKKSATPLVVVAVVVVLGAAAAWFFLGRAAPAPVAAVPAADTTSESYHAITDFLDADDWSDEQIANFNARWSTLPDDLRVAAIDQAWFKTFVERVRSRVKERRALTATADRAGNVEGPLAALASSVGIDVSSPDTVVPVPRAESRAAAVIPAGTRPAPPPAHTAPAAAVPAESAPAAAPKPAKPAKPDTTRAPAAAAPAVAAAPDDAANPDRCRPELVGSRKPRCRDALAGGAFGPWLVLIRAGEFEMGSRQIAVEEPVHRVTIARPFAIAENETSQSEYQAFCTQTKRECAAQPWQGDDYPVVRVSWQDARDYAAWLSSVSGRNYRLATEAEWEYAARGGTAALYPSGEALAQTDAVYTVTERLTTPWPRSRKINANAFRLYHTIGNVREWVEDAWAPGYAGAPADGAARRGAESAPRVVRGGAYADTAPKLRFTTRESLDPATRDTTTGFRLVREL